jgi:hypothetical protein
MKKAKMMLTALAVLGVVGGAMAFKAKHFGQHVFIQDPVSGQCNLVLDDFATTDASGIATAASVVATTDPCPATFITVAP